MAKDDEFDRAFRCIGYSYDRGFQFGYLVAKLGPNWPDTPAEELKSYEKEAKFALKLWNERCEKFREEQS